MEFVSELAVTAPGQDRNRRQAVSGWGRDDTLARALIAARKVAVAPSAK